MIDQLIIEPHYFGSLEYFGLLSNASYVLLESNQHFTKQTYKNRCKLLTPQGVKTLTVPVHFGNRSALKDVKVDYNQNWVKEHLGMIRAAYGKAAYFDFYYEAVERLLTKRSGFLIDLSEGSIQLVASFLGLKLDISMTEEYSKNVEDRFFDLRETILSKKAFKERHFYKEVSYFQNFGSIFEPNLSVLDCLMNTGPDCSRIIKESIINQ